MYPDLAGRLRQDVRKINRNEFYLVRDSGVADGSFILYHFVSSYLRSAENGVVYILAFNNPLVHYKVVLAKLGVQLQRSMDQNRCQLLDFTHYFSLDGVENEKDNSWFRFGEDNRNLFSQADGVDAEAAVKSLYFRIKDEIDRLMKNKVDSNSTPPFLIVVDCISALLDLRIPLKYVIHFLCYLRQLGRQYNASFAILAKTDESFRPTVNDVTNMSNYDRLAAFLCSSWSSNFFGKTVVFDVKPLSTGWSRDAHGEVTIREKTASKDGEASEGEQRLLYRLGDRSVAFMPPGLVPRVGV